MSRIDANMSKVASDMLLEKRLANQKAQEKPIKAVQQPKPIPTLDTTKVNNDPPLKLYEPGNKNMRRL
jgi:alpha-D-ribose 1-methylphosphonate 5-phosphate C-P lyase